MRRRKEDYIVLALAFILVMVIFGIAIILWQSSQQPPIQRTTGIAPTRYPTATTTPEPTLEEAQTKPLVQYDKEASDILLERVVNRPSLSDQDIQAKAKILLLLDESPSGYVYQTERVYIEYVNSADAFLVEIRTSNINQAKAEAVLWLQTQGMTQQGICDYPIQFYLNYDVAQFLRGSNIIFSPLAPGCE